ncbi:MAG TPA: thioredoxin domain-containing protein [Phototrophicaceae bacterium]|nr:thioredoxin domain-containing protein [Phototrophicaceae bacterium]
MTIRNLRQFGAHRPAPLPLFILLIFLLTIAPLYAQSGDRYANLPQDQSLQGFPELGYPSALVDVKLYAAYDDPASGQFWAQTFDKLLQRVRNGEVRVVFIPLFGNGSLSGGRAAARAAICAGEQTLFWQFSDQVFAGQTQDGADALSSDHLLAEAQAVGIDQGKFTECLNSDGPDVILQDATTAASNEPNFTSTPYVVVGDSPSLTDADSLNFTINQVLKKANDDLATQTSATAQATAEATDLYTFDPLEHDHIKPPLTIDLPSGWAEGYDALVLQDIDGIRPIPFALYKGPVTGGTGYIVLLWGFPNLVVGAPSGGPIEPDVWTDGTRLLRLAIVEQGCNVGTDLRRNYSVGGLQAVGTQFAAVSCPQLPDTRGWFAGLRQFDVNFVFYIYTDPISAMDGSAPQELQAILDTVKFVMPTIPATAQATAQPAS